MYVKFKTMRITRHSAQTNNNEYAARIEEVKIVLLHL